MESGSLRWQNESFAGKRTNVIYHDSVFMCAGTIFQLARIWKWY